MIACTASSGTTWPTGTSKLPRPQPNKQLLAYLLETTLIMAHPFAPFITETIWQTLKWENDSLLAAKIQRKIISHDKKKAAEFADIKAVVTEARYITKAVGVKDAVLCYTDDPFLSDNAAIIRHMAGLRDVLQTKPGEPGVGGTKETGGLYLTGTKHHCWLNISQAAAQKYLREIQVKQGQYINLEKQLRSRLDNKAYVKNAPKEVVAQTKEQLKDTKDRLAALESEMERFTITPTVQPGDDTGTTGAVIPPRVNRLGGRLQDLAGALG